MPRRQQLHEQRQSRTACATPERGRWRRAARRAAFARGTPDAHSRPMNRPAASRSSLDRRRRPSFGLARARRATAHPARGRRSRAAPAGVAGAAKRWPRDRGGRRRPRAAGGDRVAGHRRRPAVRRHRRRAGHSGHPGRVGAVGTALARPAHAVRAHERKPRGAGTGAAAGRDRARSALRCERDPARGPAGATRLALRT